MQIKSELLEHHLASNLLPVYLMSGDEPFLLQESADLIRGAAQKAGYTERKLYQTEDPDLSHLSAGIETMSLFAEKTIYEYRLDKVPNAKATKQLEQWCKSYQSDDLLIISCPKLDKRKKQANWFKAVSHLGAVIDLFAINRHEFPGWMKNRAQKMGMNITTDALNILCYRTEGNLLAANQELQRLNILTGSGETIDAEILDKATADNARFGHFELIDTCLNGETQRFIRMLHGLRDEGTSIMAITGSLNNEIRKLCRIAWTKEAGENLAQVYKQLYIWRNKQIIYNKALQRYPAKVWQQIQQRLLLLDKSIKGQANRDDWLTLEAILLVIAGQKRFSKFISEVT